MPYLSSLSLHSFTSFDAGLSTAGEPLFYEVDQTATKRSKESRETKDAFLRAYRELG